MGQVTQWLTQLGNEDPLVLCLVVTAILSITIYVTFTKFSSILKSRTHSQTIGQVNNYILNLSESALDRPGRTSTVVENLLPALFRGERNAKKRETGENSQDDS